MVKGITRQVIVVKPPDTKLFDEAIFILKDRTGISDEQILEQARRAADAYLHTRVRRARGIRWQPLVYMLLGMLSTGIPWMLWLSLR